MLSHSMGLIPWLWFFLHGQPKRAQASEKQPIAHKVERSIKPQIIDIKISNT
jgi:hypothetical protein